MASSIPTYYVYMDTRVPALHEDDGKLFKENIDSVSLSLANYFGDRTKDEYKLMLKKAYREGKGEVPLYPKRITYAQLKDLRKMPLFRMGQNKSGLITKELLRRVKPFGSLASRTIGDIYADESMGGKTDWNYISILNCWALRAFPYDRKLPIDGKKPFRLNQLMGWTFSPPLTLIYRILPRKRWLTALNRSMPKPDMPC